MQGARRGIEIVRRAHQAYFQQDHPILLRQAKDIDLGAVGRSGFLCGLVLPVDEVFDRVLTARIPGDLVHVVSLHHIIVETTFLQQHAGTFARFLRGGGLQHLIGDHLIAIDAFRQIAQRCAPHLVDPRLGTLLLQHYPIGIAKPVVEQPSRG